MASEWAQERLRKWLDEVIDLNKRKIGFRIPELLDEVAAEANAAARTAAIGAAVQLVEDVRKATAVKCAKICDETCSAAAQKIREEFGLEDE